MCVDLVKHVADIVTQDRPGVTEWHLSHVEECGVKELKRRTNVLSLRIRVAPELVLRLGQG